MKILKLLNKKYFSIILIILFVQITQAEEKPVDIWNIDEKTRAENEVLIIQTDNYDGEANQENISNLYKSSILKKNKSIEFSENLNSNEITIIGLYDPEDNGLDVNMWSNSDGDQLKNIFTKLKKIDLSDDASEIMKISILTNAHPPKKNISEKEFLKFKSDWLIKNSDLDLIEDYIVSNQIFDLHPRLTKYLVDQYLSKGEIEKACDIFQKNSKPLNDNYLFKFNIYCLIKSEKKEEAQLNFDLKKEMGFEDKYFENKINYLLGFDLKADETVSEKNLLDFHLAHMVNPSFIFEPKEKTNKLIWKYLSSYNLLAPFEEIKDTDVKKILLLEKAAHNKNYPEEDLFEIYKRFQFNINELLTAEQSYTSLPKIEARALIYQKVLLESEMINRLKYLKILKELFKDENIDKAFDTKLKKFLSEINPTEIPDNMTSFYYTNIKLNEDDESSQKKTKFNNDVLHQSKLIGYFNGDYTKSKIEKDINNFLKKIKKNKKYSFSKKDQIFLESLKFDGIEISDKYNDLYKIDNSEIPTDIQVMINNNEKGAALLRIAEVIGQDKMERIDEDTIYFIISTLNQLNIDILRNKILLKVLPLKV